MSKTAAAVKAAPIDERTSADAPAAVQPLPRDRWRARESGVMWNEHEVNPFAGVAFEALLAPEFWANIAAKMRPGDTIIAMPDDGAWRGAFLVWQVGHNFAQVTQLWRQERPEFGPAPGATAEEFEVGFAGPTLKYRVVRKKDQRELKSGFETPDAANRWIADYRKAMRA